jgi:hypothetical protein
VRYSFGINTSTGTRDAEPNAELYGAAVNNAST